MSKSDENTNGVWSWLPYGIIVGGFIVFIFLGDAIGEWWSNLWYSEPKSVTLWKNSPGTRGFINLDDVKEAFQKSSDVEGFERRVNETFEGDNLVLLNAIEKSDGFEIEAREDINRNQKYDYGDDLLFTLSVRGNFAILKGKGANRYYENSWAYNPPKPSRAERDDIDTPYFHVWFWGRGWGGYYTPIGHYNTIQSNRATYRQSDSFQSQIKKNTAFENSMSKKYGAGFRSSINNVSTTRKGYVQKKISAGNIQSQLRAQRSSSGWGVRSNITSSSGYKGSTVFGGRGSPGFGGFSGISGFGV